MAQPLKAPPIITYTALAYLTAITDTAEYHCANCAIAEVEQMQVTLKRLEKRLKAEMAAKTPLSGASKTDAPAGQHAPSKKGR